MSSSGSTNQPARRIERRTVVAACVTLWIALVLALALVFDERGARLTMLSVGVLILICAGVWTYHLFAALIGGIARDGSNSAELSEPRARKQLEREKFWILKALRELEFDFAMKKVSEEDYRSIAPRYRAQAARIIRELDAAEVDYRALVERSLAERVRAITVKGVPLDVGAAASAAAATPKSEDSEARRG